MLDIDPLSGHGLSDYGTGEGIEYSDRMITIRVPLIVQKDCARAVSAALRGTKLLFMRVSSDGR